MGKLLTEHTNKIIKQVMTARMKKAKPVSPPPREVWPKASGKKAPVVKRVTKSVEVVKK